MLRHLISASALTLALTAPVVAETDLSNLTDAQREAFRAEVRAYLLDNPDIIMEAVAVLEQRQQANEAATDRDLVQSNADAIFNDGYSWVGGNPDGDITLVEFLDYRCGYCRKAAAEVDQLIETDGNIRFIVKEFPILGEDSVIASRFAQSVRNVGGDDAYKDAHDALITYQGSFEEPALRRIAEGLGVDADAVIAGMNAPEINKALQDTRTLAGTLQISGTPTFVMDEQLLRGYVPLSAMQEIAAEIRAD
ncbi:MAG: DsbA family protein [Pseudomonadota bacterium]|nr:DsbA family protein [Pseudomonadota bacterium]